MRTAQKQKSGKSEFAYKIQPRPEKWVCASCGKAPVPKKMKGEPGFTQTSFTSREELFVHVRFHHKEG
jgi:hypothetical protein